MADGNLKGFKHKLAKYGTASWTNSDAAGTEKKILDAGTSDQGSFIYGISCESTDADTNYDFTVYLSPDNGSTLHRVGIFQIPQGSGTSSSLPRKNPIKENLLPGFIDYDAYDNPFVDLPTGWSLWLENVAQVDSPSTVKIVAKAKDF